MQIIGVDFSGAMDERRKITWIAEGELNGNVLTLNSCPPICRDCLTHKLESLKPPAVVAMDFPFSVPVEFARHCHLQMPDGGEMPDLWEAAAGIDLGQFTRWRNSFYTRYQREPRRASDPPEALSPLNIRMRPMTLRGMQMLNQLQERPEIRVPPLHPDPERNSVTLLEVMPGATLRSLGLPYKGYKNGRNADELRREILDGLWDKARPVEICLSDLVNRCHPRCYVARQRENPLPLYDICRHHDDALDSVVAAIAAALWAIPVTRAHFTKPPYPIEPTVRREGWLYTPGGCYLHGCAGHIGQNRPAAEQE